MTRSYKEELLLAPTSLFGQTKNAEKETEGQTRMIENLLSHSTEKDDQAHPTLLLPNEMLRNLSSKWERALIIRIYDGTIPTQTIKTRLQSLWKIGLQFQIKEIGKKFFIIHNLAEDERTNIIAGRPWKLGTSLIIVKSRKPNFDVQTESRKVVTAIGYL